MMEYRVNWAKHKRWGSDVGVRSFSTLDDAQEYIDGALKPDQFVYHIQLSKFNEERRKWHAMLSYRRVWQMQDAKGNTEYGNS